MVYRQSIVYGVDSRAMNILQIYSGIKSYYDKNMNNSSLFKCSPSKIKIIIKYKPSKIKNHKKYKIRDK